MQTTPEASYKVKVKNSNAHPGMRERTLSRVSSRDKIFITRGEEHCCERGVKDCWDVASYILVKLIPCFRTKFCCFRSMRDGSWMYEHQAKSHSGLAVSYEDFTNLINTLLLMSALFLAFVAASATVLGADQLLAADLNACQRGWAHQSICKDLDSAGYFGTYNATLLLFSDSVIRELKQVAGSGEDGLETKNMPMVSVDVTEMRFGSLMDSTFLLHGHELPSYAIMYFSALSMGLLVVTIMTGFSQYVTLMFTSAGTMDDKVMQMFWDSGVILVLVQVVSLLLAIVFWIQSMARIIGVLMPDYMLHGHEFIWFTHSDTNANYGVIFSAYCVEGVLTWGIIVLNFGIFFQVAMTFQVEKNIVTQRPKTIAEFVIKAISHLETDDTLREESNDTAVFRVIKLFKDQGYKVGKFEVGEKISPKDKDRAVVEMDDFIDEFAYLDWKEITEKGTDGTRMLSNREKACLHKLHAELYQQ